MVPIGAIAVYDVIDALSQEQSRGLFHYIIKSIILPLRDIYRRVDGLATSLKHGAKGGEPLSQAHQDAIAVLAQ